MTKTPRPRSAAGQAEQALNLGQMFRASALGRIGVAAVVGAGFVLGFALGGQAQAVDAPRPPTAASAAVIVEAKIGVDLDGDGRSDLARPVENSVRGVDAYGSGAFGAPRDGGSRTHGGVDFVATPGEPIRAPIAGIVTRIGPAYSGQDALQYVEIANPATRYVARVLYVGPTVRPGLAVDAGDIIGRAQSLAERYPSGMTNHVHVELTGGRVGRLNPLVVLPDSSATRFGPTA